MADDVAGTIMVAGLVITGTTLVKEIADGKVTIKPVVSGFILTGALLLMATFSGDLAHGFAILIMVTALLLNGTALFTFVKKVGG